MKQKINKILRYTLLVAIGVFFVASLNGKTDNTKVASVAVTPPSSKETVGDFYPKTPTITPIEAQPTEQPLYEQPTDTPTPEPVYPTPTPTPDGLQGQIHLHSDYVGGLVGQDSNGNQVHLHSNYAGGYQGQDSNGNQVHLNPNYAGGYNGTDNNNSTFHCNPNYANGYNCN